MAKLEDIQRMMEEKEMYRRKKSLDIAAIAFRDITGRHPLHNEDTETVLKIARFLVNEDTDDCNIGV